MSAVLRVALPLLLVALAACATNDNGGAVGAAGRPGRAAGPTPPGALHAQLPAAVAAAGVLRVGTAVGRAPLAFSGTGGDAGHPSGLEVELAVAMGRVLGVNVTFIESTIGALPGDVLTGRVDAAIAGIADRPATRAAGLDFVDYLRGRSVALVARGDPSHVGGLAGLCAKRIGAVAGSAGAALAGRRATACAAEGRPLTLVAGQATDALEAELAGGRLDAVVEDFLVASYAAQQSVPPAELQVAGDPADPVSYGVAVAHNNAVLADAIRSALDALIADGTYGAILTKWGAAASGLTAAGLNGGA